MIRDINHRVELDMMALQQSEQLRRQRQKDCHKFEVNLVYVESSSLDMAP